MRRLSQRDDRGAVTLLVVLIAPVLILCGTFVFDGGRGMVARGQVQGAADAAALAKATDCSKLPQVTTTGFAAYETNGAVLANVPTCGTGTTTVSMKQTITSTFSLGVGPWVVTRSATAKWGTIGAATTIPMTISNCEFSQALLDGTTDIVVYVDDPKPQSGCSSLPGGFSQLSASGCSVEVSAGGTVTGDPGGDLQKEIPCMTNPTAPALPHDILIPMYDAAACQAAGCKGHGPYPIRGFAMFHLTGYSFNGNKNDGTLGNKCPDPSRGKYCISGDFIRFVTSQGTPGPSTDFGVNQVYLFS
ncbi:MAG TPA: pilus assembly protein TadG-related protein [Ilumatobacteraceae bacterium]|nr:pilus assembly protein TadG-related protein [Ilumatobacteraceae bacterium]